MYKICAVSASEAMVSVNAGFFTNSGANGINWETFLGSNFLNGLNFGGTSHSGFQDALPLFLSMKDQSILKQPKPTSSFFKSEIVSVSPDPRFEFVPTAPSGASSKSFQRSFLNNKTDDKKVLSFTPALALTWYGNVIVGPEDIPGMVYANPSQKLLYGWICALDRTVGMSHGLVVHGKPGAGKTRVLTQIFPESDSVIWAKKEDLNASFISRVQASKACIVVIEDVGRLHCGFRDLFSAGQVLNSDHKTVHFVLSTSNPDLIRSCDIDFRSLVYSRYHVVNLSPVDYRVPDPKYGEFKISREGLVEKTGDYPLSVSQVLEASQAGLTALTLFRETVSSVESMKTLAGSAKRVILTIDRPINFLFKSMLCHLLDQLDRPGFSLVIVHPNKSELIQQLRDLYFEPRYLSRLKLLDLDLSKKYPERLRERVAYSHTEYPALAED